MLSIIAAVAKNNVIGKDNKLIWHLPDDLKRFKKLTSGHVIIMGRKTFESLGKVLPKRKHIVLSTNINYKVDHEMVEVVNSIDEIKEYIDSEEECFVIGGAGIYKMLLPFTQKLYLTELDKEFEGDAYFPEFDKNDFIIINKELGPQTENIDFNYEYIDYERK